MCCSGAGAGAGAGAEDGKTSARTLGEQPTRGTVLDYMTTVQVYKCCSSSSKVISSII